MIKNSTSNTGTILNRTRGIQLLLILSLLMIGTLSKAQIIYNESFDVPGTPAFPVSSLPFGWSQGKFGAGVDPDNYWDRMGVGATLPNCNPRTGNAMMRYRSWLTTAGEASFLASKRFDMRNIPLAGAPVSFWMYRDEGLTTTLDNIRVYVNTTPDMLGTPLQLTATAINRPCSQAPVVPCPVSYNVSGWNNYAFTIPNTYNGASVYVILLATSADGNHMFVDDFSITSYPNLEQAYVSSAVVLQNSATTAKGRTRQEIIGCRITFDGAVSAGNRSIANMLFNTIGSTNPVTDITNARLWYTGGSSSFDTLTATALGFYPNPHATNYNCVGGAPWSGSASFSTLEHGDNYFWITYDINATAVSGNCVDAEWISFNYRVNKTGVTGSGGTNTITVPNSTGLVVGMTAAGAGVSLGTTISNIAGTTITLANNNTGAVSGTVVFTLTANPTPQTLAGCREIDVIYCIPSYSVGTSWLNYNTNDYIANVTLPGNATAPPGINNSLNSVGPNAGGCAGGPCPFATHPPDYELFPAVPGKTAALTADGTTNYPISLKVGTYCCSNYIAAWIDFNKDGDFNDPGEKIAQSPSLSNSQVYNTTFQVPVTATTGTTRLRVREVWINPNIDPCASYTYGETEDYVVTLLPTCGVPGWKTWLGFTNDWDNPANWCGGVPTIADNARLPGTGGAGYYRPVIKPGVFATTRKLRIEPNDTLYIRAWSNSTLTVADSLYMMPAAGPLPNGVVNVISTLVDTAQVYNGLLFPSPSLTPLKNATKARSFWLFTQAELIARGLVANDVITEIKLHVQRLSNANPYGNLTLKAYYTNPAFVFVPGVNATVPPAVGPAPVVIYGPTNTATASFIAGVGNWGTITYLTSGFIWDGSANKLVIEMCYESLASTGSSDQPRYTQTLGFRNYMTMLAATATSPSACEFIPPTTQTASGSAGTNQLTVTNGLILVVGQQVAVTAGIPANTYITAIAGNVLTLSNNLTANIVAATLTFGGNIFHTASDFRPNLTFKFDRPFNRYEIEVRGAWGNNGVFTPGKSRVTMGNSALAGANPVQNLAGSSITTFADLRIFNNNHVYAQNDFIVEDTLQLTSGRLKLNNRLATLLNPDPAAITRINGFLQSDQDVIANNVGPYGRLQWNMGSTVGNYVLPYVNAAGVSIFMDYTTVSGTHNPIFATHGTAPTNLATPAPITNINGYFTGTNNSANMVDRFYMIDNTAGSGTPTADMKLRYASSEQAALGNAAMSAQRWLAPSAGWEYPFITGQSYAANTVTLTGFNSFSSNIWWTITQTSAPLPISLLDFAGKPYEDKVKLTWETASEINNSHFIIERTTDQLNFDYIGRVESQGSSSSIAKYSIWDEQPLQGIQYYYLRQYDIDGTMKSYGPVSATFSRDLFDIVTATAVNAEKGLIVEFDYNSDETYKYSVVDMLGKVLATNDKNVAQPGRNKIEIDVKLSQGVYQIILQNSEKVVSKKFYYDKL